MKDKALFKRLRVLIAAGSIVGFAGGWGLLAQAGVSQADRATPVAQVVPTTSPVTSAAGGTSNGASSPATTGVQPTPVTAAPTAVSPVAPVVPLQSGTTTQATSQIRLRTGGS